ncbi:unnamed protein product, partial [Closterium sp. NIES-65]
GGCCHRMIGQTLRSIVEEGGTRTLESPSGIHLAALSAVGFPMDDSRLTRWCQHGV